jgi:hypothetical protein
VSYLGRSCSYQNAERYLEALKALRSAAAIDATYPQLLDGRLRLYRLFTAEPAMLSESEQKVYESLKDDLFPFSSVDTAKSDFLQQHAQSPKHILAAAQLQSETIRDRGVRLFARAIAS